MHLACKFVFKLPGNRKIIGKHKIIISKFIRLLIVIICTKISSLSKLYVSLDFFFQISTNLKLSIHKINFSWRISNFIYLAKNPQDSPLRVVIATVALGMTGGRGTCVMQVRWFMLVLPKLWKVNFVHYKIPG